MKEKFDFDKAGKRMPYTVPDDFFAEMEEDVWSKLERRPTATVRKSRPFVRVALTAVTTAAEAVALLLILDGGPHSNHPANSFADVERAFANLTTEDQQYIFSVYEDD